MIRNAMFYLNQNKPSVFDTVRVCAELCRERGIEPIFFEANREELIEKLGDEAETARYLPEPEAGTVDMLFVFGGDGTVLRALDMYVDRDIPILGINLGRLGFLLETQTQELPEALDMLVRGEYAIERRMMLYAEGMCNGKPVSAYATNEVSISRPLPADDRAGCACRRRAGGSLHRGRRGAGQSDRLNGVFAFGGRADCQPGCAVLCAQPDLSAHAAIPADCAFRRRAGDAAAEHEGDARGHAALH